MKRIWIWIGAALVVIVTVVAIRAETRGGGWCPWHGHHATWGPGWYMAHELNLTDAQKKQIGTIWDGERPRVAGLIRELASEQAELRAASREKNDGKVQEIASQQGASVAKLLMEKERMCGEIYASVLNADQRKKADALQDKISQRLTGLADRLNDGGAHEN
jgi:Spy/CpxP family protein refolding chaperone